MFSHSLYFPNGKFSKERNLKKSPDNEKSVTLKLGAKVGRSGVSREYIFLRNTSEQYLERVA